MKFTGEFDKYVCVNDTLSVTIGPFDVIARIEFDEDSKIDDDDCHNTDQSVTGCDDEQFEKLMANRKAWQNDEWFYCGIVLSVWRNGVELNDCAASLWGIECNYPTGDNSYLTEVVNQLLPDAIAEGHRISAKFHEPISEDLEEWQPASHWDEHPQFPVDDWKAEVIEDATRQSYVEWVNSNIEEFENIT